MDRFKWIRALLVVPVLLTLAAKPAPTKAPAPPAASSAAGSPAEPPRYSELDPDLMGFKIHLYRYLNYCDAIRELRKDLPASKVLDAPPLEGLGMFRADDFWQRMNSTKKAKAEVLKEWTDTIEKRWAEHRKELGTDGL